MKIIAKCPRCNSCWILESTAADKRITCSKCGRIFKVPALLEIPKAAQKIKNAKAEIYVNKDGYTFG